MRLAHAQLAFAWLATAFCLAAFAKDIPNSKDPPFLKRYEGSEIVSYHGMPEQLWL